MKTKVLLGILAIIGLGACVSVLTYGILGLLIEPAQPTTAAPIEDSRNSGKRTEPIGNNIWVTDDPARGVSCYRSAQYGGTLSCVKVK